MKKMNSDAAKIILEQGIKIDQLKKRVHKLELVLGSQDRFNVIDLLLSRTEVAAKEIGLIKAKMAAPKFETVGIIEWRLPWWKRLIKKIMPARI